MNGNERQTLYVVTEGDYSAYHIVGIYSTRENAEIVRKKFNGEIAEWKVDDGADEICRGHDRWRVTCHTGAASDEKRWSAAEAPWLSGYDAATTIEVDEDDFFEIRCWARGEQHALKIASEMVAQYVATHPDGPTKADEEQTEVVAEEEDEVP